MREKAVLLAAALAGLAAPAPAGATYPGWNGPIYYTGFTHACPVIRAVRPDRPGSRLVLADCLDEAARSTLSFTPDGRALTLLWDGLPAAMTPDGFDHRLLPLGPGAYVSGVSYSPDGRRLAFARDAGVWTARADGSGRRLLVRGGRLAEWSPAGGVIALELGRSQALWLVDASTGRKVRRLAAWALDPDFSPDGSRLAYGAPDGTIHVIGVDGRGDRSATARAGGRQWSPAWSPDGRWIAYAQLRRRENGSRASVCVVPAAGGSARCLAGLRYGADSDAELTVAWRPLRRRRSR